MAKTVENNHSIIFTHSILLKVIELHHLMWFLFIFTDIPELIYFAPWVITMFSLTFRPLFQVMGQHTLMSILELPIKEHSYMNQEMCIQY